MEVAVHTTAEVFLALGDDWRALVEADPSGTVFHRPEYLGIWWTEFAAGGSLEVLAIRDGARLAGVVPLVAGDDGVHRFAGDPEVTDYLGPVSLPEDRAEVSALTLAHAGARSELGGLAGDSGWPEALVDAAKRAGRPWATTEQDVCPRIAVDGFESYLAGLPGKLRHEIRRKDRRLREAGSVSSRLSDANTIEEDLDAFLRLNRSAEEDKAEFFSLQAREAFFSALAAAFTNHGLLRNVVLEFEGRAVAVAVGFAYKGVWSLYNSAFDRSLGGLAPGMVLVSDAIRLAAAEGCRIFDFLRGREEYKYRFGASDVPVVQVAVE